MKNANKAFSLLLSAAALVSIASCGKPVNSKANTLVSYTDNSGVKVDFTTNELLFNYLDKDTTASVEEYYNIAYDAMVKKYFAAEDKKDVLKGITRDAKNEVEKKKQQAENAADTNKTKYEDEWKAILDSELSNLKESRRNEKKLLEKFELAKMREKVADDFYDKFKDYNKEAHKGDKQQQEYNIFWGDNGYLEKRIPYHVKHILVKVGAADGALYNAEITSDNAQKLSRVITSLAKGQDFGDVAKLQSDDSSNTSFGNLGIMDTATSFVNEFKLGTYVYDTLFNNNEGVKVEAEKDPFNMGDDTKNFFNDLGVAEIPYSAVKDLAKYSDITENKEGKKVNEDNPLYYPRNIIFNKYFNNHNFGFIVKASSNAKAIKDGDTSAKGYDINGQVTTDEKKVAYYSDLEDGKWGLTEYNDPDKDTLTGFESIKFKDGKTREVLCDDNRNPILVVRAGTADYQGLHLISIERSGLEKEATYQANIGTEENPNYKNYTSSLEEYYTAINPKLITNKANPDFPVIEEGSTVQQKTYINNVVTGYNEYNQRVDTLKNTIKNFDPSYDKKVFKWLSEMDGVGASEIVVKVTITVDGEEKTTPVNITDKINKYVNREIAEHNTSAFTISDETWEGYTDYLKNQEAERKTKLIPETCALSYWDGEGYETVCHYSKEK